VHSPPGPTTVGCRARPRRTPVRVAPPSSPRCSEGRHASRDCRHKSGEPYSRGDRTFGLCRFFGPDPGLAPATQPRSSLRLASRLGPVPECRRLSGSTAVLGLAPRLCPTSRNSSLPRVSNSPPDHGPGLALAPGSESHPTPAGSRTRPPWFGLAPRLCPESQTRLPTTVSVSHSPPARTRTQVPPSSVSRLASRLCPDSGDLEITPSRPPTLPQSRLALRVLVSRASPLEFTPSRDLATRLYPKVANSSLPQTRLALRHPRASLDFTPSRNLAFRLYPKVANSSLPQTRLALRVLVSRAPRLSTLPQVGISPLDFTPSRDLALRLYPEVATRSRAPTPESVSRLYPESRSRPSTTVSVSLSLSLPATSRTQLPPGLARQPPCFSDHGLSPSLAPGLYSHPSTAEPDSTSSALLDFAVFSTTVLAPSSPPAGGRTQPPPSPTRPAPHFWTLPFSRPRSLPLPRPRPVVAPNHRRARLDHRTFGLSRFFKGVASFCVTPLTL
jgi:hypothetical protein